MSVLLLIIKLLYHNVAQVSFPSNRSKEMKCKKMCAQKNNKLENYEWKWKREF